MVPPRGGGEASLKEQKEAGLEHGDTDSSGQEVGLIRWPWAPAEGDWVKHGLGPPMTTPPLLTRPMGEEVEAMEPVTIGRRVGRLRNREGRREEGPPGPPRSMWAAPPSRLERDS